MLIGVNGTKGSGKDTIGKYLVEHYEFERLSFAQKLKDSAAALFEVDPSVWEELKNDDNARIILKTNNDIFDDKWSEIDLSVRYFLQRYGTESHRNIFGGDFWVDALFKDFDHWDGKNYVITDARFNNELKAIKERNGFNIRVVRQEGSRLIDPHVSEAMPARIYLDYDIYNDAGFDRLYKQVDDFMAQFPMIDKNVASSQATAQSRRQKAFKEASFREEESSIQKR